MKTLKNDLIKYKSELKECLDFGIKGAGSNYLYADADPYDNYYYGSKYMDAIKYLYNTISLHPLEFVKAAREETYNVGIEDIPSEVDLEPVVKEINKETNKFYFVYPPFFYKMVEECGLKEFNPYENLSPRTPRFYSAQGNITFKDNPGFVPYRTSVFENKYKEGDLHQGNFYYPEINVGFNIMTDASYGLHMGIDFPGETGTKIKALVYGKVWACTWDKSIKEESGTGLGRVMIIKGNDNLMYLLCHLSGFIKDVGDDVFPGDDVAYVGNTGNSFGSHLHLEVHKTNVVGCELQKKDEILNKSKTVNMKEPNGQNGLRWKSSYTRKRVNPFYHEEVFKND